MKPILILILLSLISCNTESTSKIDSTQIAVSLEKILDFHGVFKEKKVFVLESIDYNGLEISKINLKNQNDYILDENQLSFLKMVSNNDSVVGLLKSPLVSTLKNLLLQRDIMAIYPRTISNIRNGYESRACIIHLSSYQKNTNLFYLSIYNYDNQEHLIAYIGENLNDTTKFHSYFCSDTDCEIYNKESVGWLRNR